MMKPRCLPSVLVALGLIPVAGQAIAAPAYGVNKAGLQVIEGANGTMNQKAFSYVKLQHGVQVRVGTVVKNIMFYGPETVRVNATLGKVHTKQPSLTVIAKPPVPEFQIEENDKHVRLIGKKLTVEVSKNSGAVAFLRADGSLITRERQEQPSEIKELTISNAPTYEVKQSFTLSKDESLYGLGQYDRRYMDYRGQEVDMVQTNIGIVVPFLISTNRYGIMWDAYSKTRFKDDANGASFWSESSPAGVDYYFIAGDTMDDVIGGYRELTGHAPMFPKAAFGLFMSKERYKTQDRLIEVVKEFRKEGFPLDYIVQDWQYWGGDKDGTWSGMTWNKERFPDPAGLTKTLHDDLNVKLMISIWPSVGNDTELAKELDSKGLRFEPLHWISRKARIYDAFSPEGRAIYFKHIKKGLLDAGVDALWMDGTEVEVGTACHDPRRVEADIKSLGNNAMGDFTRYLNPYSLMTTKGTYEGQRATRNKRVLTLTRSAFTGQQRYAALSWSGDTTASWETFRSQISGGLNVAMAGQPYWTQDTGGFFVRYRDGERNPEYRELFARWHQFGAFNPIYRIHGTSVEREPYIFKNLDPEVYKSLLAAAHLRYRLLPYIYSLAWQSTANGYTMMRGLPMDFPDDLKARKLDDQFLFGPAFLVQPVTKPMYSKGTPPPPVIPTDFLHTPDGQPGVAVEYFKGRNFEKSVSKSIDEKVDYTWPGPPLAELPAGLESAYDFSGRWQGTITASEDGEHEIGVEGDDGFRLWLDGKLVAEDWAAKAMRYQGAKITLSKGQKVPFKIEYFQGSHDRGLRLGWRTPSELASGEIKVDNAVETYLPTGADWFDFWTNERHAGGQRVSKNCPLDILPLYVRAGSIIPMGPVMNYSTEKPSAPYEIRIYPGADAKFTLYEDDNETYDYEKGRFAVVDLTWDDASRTLTVGKRKGSYPGMTLNRDFRVVLAGSEKGFGIPETPSPDKTVTYGGEALTVTF